MIITHNYEKFPENIDYRYGEIGEFSNFELEDLERLGIEEIWYWYAYGSYEGMGQILMRKGGLFDIHDAGHCSCYGPTEHADFRGVPFDQLLEGWTEEHIKEVEPLIAMAKSDQSLYRIW